MIQATEEVTVVAHDVGGIGGMERQLETLVGGLAERGHQVTVIARRSVLPPHVRVRTVLVRGPGRPFLIAFPWFFLRASVVVRRRRRGILHATGAIIANRADVVTVHFCHAAYRERANAPRVSKRSFLYRLNAALAAPLSRAAERWCYRPSRVRALAAVSAGVGRELERHFPAVVDRVEVVPNGVDASRFRPPTADDRRAAREKLGIPQDALIALFVGGEWERKGLRHAIEAVAASPAWRLVVVGAGERQRYASIARAAGAIDRLTFLPPTHQLVAVYAAADAFVLPSVYETFSLVAHEAAACGLPLLVTRVSGVEDLLRDGVNGWFVDGRAEDISRRLQALQADVRLRERMAAAARESSLAFTWRSMVDRYERIYAGLRGPAR